MKKYIRDSDWQINQSKQPLKFTQAAYRGLSKNICGEEDFFAFLSKYIQKNGVDDNIRQMLKQYEDGEKYIKDNKTQWSKRR